MRMPLIAFSALVLAAGDVVMAAGRPADIVVADARVYTADAKHTMAEALAVRDGKLAYVGSNAGVQAFVGPKTRVERLGGRLVLPGLFDSHIHPMGIVDLDVCNLRSEAKSLKEMSGFVRGCIDHFKIPAGEWVVVRQWNYSNKNEPDADHPTVRAALDRASAAHPIQLLGNDGHHGGFNSMALARATDATGKKLGFSKATLASEFKEFKKLVGVDESGEPNGIVTEDARRRMDPPSLLSIDVLELLKAPERIPQRLNSVGITGMLDAAARPDALEVYDALVRSGKLTVRTQLALYYDPDVMRTSAGAPDWDRMLATAKSVRERYSREPMVRADFVKLFADGVLEGNPRAIPPTLPEVASVKPYLQPIFATSPDGKQSVTGYVDTASALCAAVRAHPERYDSASDLKAFVAQHGYHPGQCEISSGQLQHDRDVILEFVKRFHLAHFNVHIHAIGDMPVRTAVDAIEAARAADGVRTTHDGLAHIQLVNPDDAPRIGREHLYLAFTYAWAYAEPEYDLSVIPFIDHVHGGDYAALHPKDGYYERNAYPVRSLRDKGAILVAGSDAPVDTSDPRPFVNMALAVTRRFAGMPPLNAAQSISIRDVIDAYTINGARFLFRDQEAGSLEVGKSADFVVLDQDILALADQGHADDIAKTHAELTYFEGKEVYRKAAR